MFCFHLHHCVLTTGLSSGCKLCCSDRDAGECVEHLLWRRTDVRGRRHFWGYVSSLSASRSIVSWQSLWHRRQCKCMRNNVCRNVFVRFFVWWWKDTWMICYPFMFALSLLFAICAFKIVLTFAKCINFSFGWLLGPIMYALNWMYNRLQSLNVCAKKSRDFVLGSLFSPRAFCVLAFLSMVRIFVFACAGCCGFSWAHTLPCHATSTAIVC